MIRGPLLLRASLPLGWVLAVLCLLATLLLGGLPATAVDSFRLAAPAAGTSLEGTFTIEVVVDPSDGEIIEGVEAQLAGPTNRVFQLNRVDGPGLDGEQRWALQVDPLGQQPMHNGRHRLVVRPVPAAGEPPAFQGHDVVLAVPFQGELVAAPTGEDATVVALTWDPVDLPDFLAYRIQRRPDTDSGLWRTVARFDDPSVRDTNDEVDDPGAYLYRLVVVRSDGDDGEVVGFSPSRGVRADPADPGTFDPPSEPDDRPSVEPTPTSQPGGPIGRPGNDDVAQDPGPAETGTATVTPEPSTPRPVTVPAPAPAPPAPAPPAVVPLDDGVFEPLLPIGPTETELELTETETALLDGSVRPGGSEAILTTDEEEGRRRQLVLASATGLLLVVVAGHLRRYLSVGSRR